MSRDWAPGDVAMVTREGETRIALRADQGWSFADIHSWLGDRFEHGARPLVVIDPESDADVARMENILEAHGCRVGSAVRAALREFADPKPPKPAEPTGLGAVVEDDRGVRWVRVEPKNGMTNPWQATLHVAEPDTVRSLRWSAIDAVRVLSEGVTL